MLKAIGKSDLQEILALARQSVASDAEAWREKQPELRRIHRDLEAQLQSAADETDRSAIKQQIKPAKQRRGLAAAIVSKAEAGQSSVAPLFLQPEQEVGKLILIEGIARRAVRIAVEGESDLEAYHEVEVFTSDSQNLPVVCCVTQLPAGFPSGDQIREPVRICGVFFKSWRYRSRDLTTAAGETARQRQMYTPVVIGKEPRWLRTETSRDNVWGLWGGLAFLCILALLWMTSAVLGRADRQARAELRKSETINL